MSEHANSFRAMAGLMRYARGYRGRIALATFYSVANKIFDVLPELLIGAAIDVVVRREESILAGLGLVDPFHQILALGVATLLIWALESLFEFAQLVTWRNLAQQLQHDMRLDGYEHLQGLDMAWFEDASTGNLVAVLNDDVNQMERFLNGGANDLIQMFTAVVAVGTVFFVISPKIALMAFTPIPVIVIGAFWFQKRAQPLYAKVRERAGLLSSRLANNIAGIATIKSFTRERDELERLRGDSQAYLEANRRAIRVSSSFIPIIRMAILAGFMATLIYGGYLTLQGQLNAGAYGVLVFLTQRLLWPLTRFAENVDLFERAMASTRRILNLIETPIGVRGGTLALPHDAVRGAIEFRGVDFAYGDGRPVLRGIDLEIGAGENVAFVGQTGSGKSTLVKLLLRFYAPQRGQVLLDGHDLADVSLPDLRASIGLVSQDVYLFHGSVYDNIAYGAPGADPEAVRAAAKAAEADDFIQALPQGYDTLVGERGQKLSGGQQQRLSIARAVLKNPRILVLDEATSSVDNETEAAIQRSMTHIAEGRTTLVIAHRLSTIVGSDRIYVLDGGRIVEQGTHRELMEADGLYASLWRVQTGQHAG